MLCIRRFNFFGFFRGMIIKLEIAYLSMRNVPSVRATALHTNEANDYSSSTTGKIHTVLLSFILSSFRHTHTHGHILLCLMHCIQPISECDELLLSLYKWYCIQECICIWISFGKAVSERSRHLNILTLSALSIVICCKALKYREIVFFIQSFCPPSSVHVVRFIF